MIDQFLAIQGPDEKAFAKLNKFIEFYFSPTLIGQEHIPEGPTMIELPEDFVPPIPKGIFHTLLPKP